MSQAKNQSAVASTERAFSFSPREIFGAFRDPEKLARWWGPKDFTNTFETFEFKPGGRWVFVMHGPNGANYPNESTFRELVPDSKVVIEHISPPRFTLTVVLTARGEQTHLSWAQAFESAEVTAKLRPIVEPANEQNLDRLQSVLDEVPVTLSRDEALVLFEWLAKRVDTDVSRNPDNDAPFNAEERVLSKVLGILEKQFFSEAVDPAYIELLTAARQRVLGR